MSTADTTCTHCENTQPHPLWIYLMRDKRCPMTEINEINNCEAYIGVSRLPLQRIECHNRIEGYRVGAKCSKSISPHWQIEMVIGPFDVGGKQFKQDWRKASRKLSRRIVYGISLANSMNMNIYFRDDVARAVAHRLIDHYSNKEC